jgi:hypothetical protein
MRYLLLPALLLLTAAAPLTLPPPLTPIPVNPGAATQPAPDAATPILQVTAIREPPSDKLLKDTLAALDLHRRKLASIHVTAATRYEEFDPAQKAWKSLGSIAGEAWLESAPPRRARFDIALQHSPWSNGSKPFYDETYLETFDGAQTRHFTPSTRRATIRPDRLFFGDAVAGAHAALPFLWTQSFAQNGQPLVDDFELSPAAIKDSSLSARRVTLNNTQHAIEITRTPLLDPTYLRRYYLDPDHAFALLGTSDQHRRLYVHQLTIHALAQPSPGLFYPQSFTSLQTYADDNAERATFTASQITANESLPDTFFTQTFPPNTLISKEPPRHPTPLAPPTTTTRP